MSLVLFLAAASAWAAPASITLADGTEVTLRAYPGQGDILLLGFACDEGHGIQESIASSALAGKGLETWMPDMLGAHFLPAAASSIDQLPIDEFAEIMDRALKLSGKKAMVLITAGRGALPVLRGAKAWQEKSSPEARKALLGAVLFYPELYSVTPAPGVEAQYHSIVAQTNLPLFIYQGQRSPGRWWLEHLKVEFRKGGSTVDSKILPNVRGYFFSRADPTPEEKAMAARLPELVQEALQQMNIIPGDSKP